MGAIGNDGSKKKLVTIARKESSLMMIALAHRASRGPDCNCAQESLLSPQNPGADFLSSEDWIAVATRLQLTMRELGVAVLMFEGHTRFQISRRLGCAPGTVRVYIDRLHAKLQVNDRVGVVLRIVRVHWALTQAPTDVSSHKDATCEACIRD
jgi:DNA-binding NarL/FixJ family response regulator